MAVVLTIVTIRTNLLFFFPPSKTLETYSPGALHREFRELMRIPMTFLGNIHRNYHDSGVLAVCANYGGFLWILPRKVVRIGVNSRNSPYNAPRWLVSKNSIHMAVANYYGLSDLLSALCCKYGRVLWVVTCDSNHSNVRHRRAVRSSGGSEATSKKLP